MPLSRPSPVVTLDTEQFAACAGQGLALEGLAACRSGVSDSDVQRLTRTLARLEPAASLALNAVAATEAAGTATITFAQTLIKLSDD